MRKLFQATLAVILVLGLILVGCTTTPTQTSAPPKTAAAPPVSSTAPAQTTSAAPATSAVPTTSAQPASTTAANAEPIKIGALLSLTGESAVTGPPQKTALQYRLDQIGWQVAGRPIKLIVDDDASNPTSATDAVKKQILLDKVDVVLGSTQGAAAAAVANYMKTASPAVPNFQVMPKNPSALQNVPNNNIYLTFGNEQTTGYYMGLYAADKLKYKTTTTLLEDMVSGWGVVQNGFTTAFQKAGGTSIQQQPVKSGTIDFSANLAALKPADCVTFWFTPGLTARFVAQYFASGKTMPLLMPDSSVLFSPTMTQIGEKTIGIVGTTNYSLTIDTPINNEYTSGYFKKNGVMPTSQAAAMDQALLIFLEAVKNTKGDTTPAVLNAAIHKVKVETPIGTVSYTPEGMGIGDLYIVQAAKFGDRIDWKVLDKDSQIVLDVPK